MRALPVVYACSGCSSAGALADGVARTLDRERVAEMASIAGIGAHDAQQLSRARSRFPVVAIDGCPNACARRCLERHGIKPARCFVLSRYGSGEPDRVLKKVRAELGC